MERIKKVRGQGEEWRAGQEPGRKNRAVGGAYPKSPPDISNIIMLKILMTSRYSSIDAMM
jgi:hypothetical protein